MVEREWVLLNPGPANTSPAVRRALLTPDVCHREPEFFEVMRDCRERLVRVAGCAADFAAVVLTYGHYASQEADSTPFTPAVQVLHAMREALVELEKEGVLARIARYAENARVLRAGMAALGFQILVPEGARSSILTAFRLRPGLTYDPLHDAMKRRGYVIYAGQGDIRTYAFRVANMGTLTPRDMEAVVLAFGDALAELGVAR
jgi:aspartate aminotransferase-like enzyme